MSPLILSLTLLSQAPALPDEPGAQAQVAQDRDMAPVLALLGGIAANGALEIAATLVLGVVLLAGSVAVVYEGGDPLTFVLLSIGGFVLVGGLLVPEVVTTFLLAGAVYFFRDDIARYRSAS